MRQFLLVIVLVAAAFFGGAFVNGPGLQWVQTKVLRSLGLNDGGEISSVELKSVTTDETGTNEPGSIRSEKDAVQGPLAPTPSLLTENELSQQDTSNQAVTSQPSPRSKDRTSDQIGRERPVSPPAVERRGARTRAPVLEPPVSDLEVTPAKASTLATNSRLDPSPRRPSWTHWRLYCPQVLRPRAGSCPCDVAASSSSNSSAIKCGRK